MRRMKDIIYINPEEESRFMAFMWNTLITVSVYAGIFLMILPFMSVKSVIISALAAGFVSLALCFAASYFFPNKGYIKIIVVAAPVLAAALRFGDFSSGMLSFFNEIAELIKNRFAIDTTAFEAQSGLTGEAVFFSVFFALIADFLHSLSIGKRYGEMFVFIFVQFLFWSVLRLKINTGAMILCMVSVMMTWETAVSHTALHMRRLVAIACGTAVAVLVFENVFASFSGSYAVMKVKNTVMNTYHMLRYGNDTLPDGELSLAYKLLDGDETRLEIDFHPPGEMYLSGYVASDFSDEEGKWNQHDGEIFSGEWDGLFGWLEDEGFYARFAAANALALANQGGDADSIEVKNVGGDRRYLYVPYLVTGIDSGKYKIKYDLSFGARGAFGASKYSLTSRRSDSGSDDFPELIALAKNIKHSQSGAADVYAGFVNNIYTRIDDETAAVMNEIFFKENYADEEQDLYSAVTRIRAVLELRTSYSSNPPRYTSSDGRFADWFLNNKKVGNSVYFATVGALALREAGYPARYTEGYFLPNGSDAVEITTQNSHAWTEVYISHIGWIPVEFTPGFYQDSVIGEQTVEISKESAGNGSDEENSYKTTEEYNEPNNPSETDREFNWKSLAICCILSLIGAAGIFLISILIRKWVICVKRKKIFESEHPEREMYAYIFRMLKLGGVECDSSRPEDCAEMTAEVFKGVRNEEYMRMVRLMQKTVFGGIELEPFEVRSIRKFCMKLRRILYRQSSPLKRLMLRYRYVV